MEKSRIIISAKNLKKDYSRGMVTHALNGVSLEISRGEFAVIKGESGCGKTTLLNCISGLDDITSGTVLLKGKDVTNVSKKEKTLLFREIGFIFQDAARFLIPYISALDNVAKGIEPLGIKNNIIKERAENALVEVGLGDRLDHLPSELSGGECQRVAIARAMIKNPIIIFADEPTGNLDSMNSNKILELFEMYHEKGNTILMVTHSEKFKQEGKRIITMKDGLIESLV